MTKLFRNTILIVIAVLQYSLVLAQDHTIDSLKHKLAGAKGEHQFDVTLELIDAYSKRDMDTALLYTDQALKLSTKIDDSSKIATIYRIKGQLLNTLTRYNESIPFLEKARAIAERNNVTEELKGALNAAALSYTHRAEFDKALEYYFASLRIREQQKDTLAMAIAYSNVGLVYYKMKRYAKALEYNNLALELKNRRNDKYDLDRLYINMSLCHLFINQLREAKHFAELGLATCDAGCDDQIRIEGEFALGEVFLFKKDLAQARHYFESSLALSRKTGNERFKAENLAGLALISIEQWNYKQAEDLLLESESIALSNHYTELLINIYSYLRTLYDKTGDYKKLAAYQSRYIETKEQIFSEERMANLAQLQADFEEREHLQIIESQKQTMALQETSIRQQRSLNMAIAFVACLLVLIVVLLYTQNQNKKRLNQSLDIQVQEHTRELEAKQKMLENSYHELQHFIRSTSNSINAPLATLKGISHVAARDIHDDPDVIKYFQELEDASEQLTDVVNKMQRPSEG